jgi:hypothetical protein
MIPFAKINKGYKYILTCIDVFSRFARTESVKAKDGPSVSKAVRSMLETAAPRCIQTDYGKEFYNKHVSSVMKEFNVKHYSVNSLYKAALVERFNRTLRERLSRYFTHHGNKKWIEVLPTITESYNKSPHRSLKGNKRPIDLMVKVEDFNDWEHQEKQQQQHRIRGVKLYKVGDFVRISRLSISPFRKNFDQNWSEEVFRIAAIDQSDFPVMYLLQDINDEIIQGKFYHQELQQIGDQLPSVNRTEKIIQIRSKGKNKQYLVKWLGYDNSRNSWIREDQFTDTI